MKYMENNYNINEASLMRYFSGEIVQKERIQIEDWIAQSEENKKIAKQIYYIYFATDTIHTMNALNTNAALSNIHSRMHKRKHISWKRRIQQAAAILFIPLLFSTIYFSFFTWPKQEKMSFIEVRTNPGMTTAITLPDSSKVWLNSESYLRYPSKFDGDLRSVQLIGEAYFDVERDEKRKFVVNTSDNLQIEVLGTEFNIDAYTNKPISTTLVSGKVKISYSDDNNNREYFTMQPNQKVIYDQQSKSIDVLTVRVDPDVAWKDGKIIFSDTSLEDALNILGKRFNVDFVIKDKKLKENRFTGTFVNQRLDIILEHFRVSSNIKYRYTDITKHKNIPEKIRIEIY